MSDERRRGGLRRSRSASCARSPRNSARIAEAVQQDDDSVGWAERVTGLVPRSLAARRAPRRRSAPRHPVLPAERQVDHRRAQGRRPRPPRRHGGRRRAVAAPVEPAVPQAQPASRRRRREAPARDADRTRNRPRRPRALPARRPARHAARAVAALADHLAPDRRRGGAGARDDVGDDLADARRGTARASGAPVDAGRCRGRVSSGDDQPATATGGGSPSRAEECSRIAPAFLARERIRLGDALFRQEYDCEFIASPGSVFSADVLAAMFGKGEIDAEDDDGESPAVASNGARFVL